ncbi:OsmC family peroxiredoxin [Fulvivirga sp. RKSG066]|uniref:OsmC family protein n=1 Tax=Fulvivirga aurantia TaxID=2529383 RepID=UPI0012BCE082|nr:OsmC family protein [Fulvivirga aurantia]MTI21989.1 OsmC family peroxiredoxin [Fulvivirga aurantia]
MHSMESEYLGELRSTNQHLKSGQKVITDAPTDNNGKGEAFSPTDLVCSALSACMMTIMGIVARRENVDLTGMTSKITKEMSANPRKIAKITVEFEKNGLEASDKQKEMLKNAALTCPVALSLDPAIEQKVSFSF